MDAQPRNCPICNVPPSKTGVIGSLVANHDKLPGREYVLTDCACGDLIYLSPAPSESDIHAMYATSRQFDQEEVYRGETAKAAEAFYTGRARALLAKMGRPETDIIKVLEIGAGLSWLCLAAKNVNSKNITVAQDVTSEVVQECTWVDHYHVADMLGHEVEPHAPYDIVSMTHVIEHLVDPVGMLKRVRELIAPKGVVFVTAPHRPLGWKNGGGIEKWRDWSYNHVPAHVQYFARGGMERAAREAGFELVRWDGAQEEGQVFEAWLQPFGHRISMIAPAITSQADRYREEFKNASPFPHVVIDDFFKEGPAEQLLADFPPFDPANALNEFGKVGGKATIANISKISPVYAEVFDYIASREFLDVVAQITGIPDLVHDEQMFGGGTHENLEGQELDTHVDFNVLEPRKLHRRLNVLLYLNKEWEQEWGGCLEIHSNPRRPKEDQIKVIAPAFNRCVIFETSERSWHGFERIRLPRDKKHITRKLLSIYLYTLERPADEIVPSHGTFYVQRPMPAHLAPGRTLTEEDVRQIEDLFTRRDSWIEHYHKKELQVGQTFLDFARQVEWLERGMRIPLSGSALQEGPARGFWPDLWIANPFEVALRLREDVESLILSAVAPEYFREGLELCVSINGGEVSRHQVPAGPFSITIPVAAKAGELLKLVISAEKSFCPADAGVNSDGRKLLVVLRELHVVPRQREKKAVRRQARPGFWRSVRDRFR